MPPSVPRRSRSGPQTNGPTDVSAAAHRTRTLPVRRTRLVRLAVWAAVAAGPLALIASCAHGQSAAAPRLAPVTRADDHTEAAADPAGFAELFLGLWLRSGTGQDSPAARQLHVMAPSVQPPTWGERAPGVERLTAVRTARQGDGAWSVTVAVELKDAAGSNGQDLVRYFALPVVATDAASGSPGSQQAFAVTGAPAEIAGPAVLHEPDDPYGAQVPTGSALASTVGQFLSAYLGAEDGAERYLAPGTTLPALPAAAFTTVSVDELKAVSSTDGTAGHDGDTARVQAQITAKDADGGQWPLAYALELRVRGGRWEVVTLQSGLESTAAKTGGTRTSSTAPSSTAQTTSAFETRIDASAPVAGVEVTR
ncbi:conjugal transfer protein [Streptomyces sp. NPDC020801]|uniref:conjugal transfer protein n=1 Tax=Streptomyces sp. NPDC020801 TaxID=3365093 RepID=UPI0037BC9198